MPLAKPRLHVLICSTRPQRVGPLVAQWVFHEARSDGRFDVRLVDLAAFALPVYDEPLHPRLKKYTQPHTLEWSASVDSADAFVFVMPEYNYGPPPSLLNALNYLVQEWQYKPVAFVSYGGMSGGIRGVQVTKQLLTTFKVVPLLEAVAIPQVADLLSETAFRAQKVHEQAAVSMFDELMRWTPALASLRRDIQGFEG
jgi:NAD(P)H-dependent FMN reductase